MNIRNLTVLLLLCTGASLYAEIEALARFEPARIAIGNSAKYIVEVTDSDTSALSSAEQITSLPIPTINGISFRNGQTSTSQKTSIINGRAEYQVTQQIIVDAIPSKTGSFTIPAYSIDYKNTRLPVPAATLTVVERSANTAPTTNESIFLSLDAPEKLYVGQTKQATLKLYIAENVRLGDYLIEPDADGFITTGGPPEEPSESAAIANGRRYRVYSWPLTITPISSGRQDINYQSTLIAQFPSQRTTRNSPFGGSIFDDLFGRTERINVYTRPTTVDVLPLPNEDKPESFSGAIGQFNIGVSADAKSTRVGEPIMLSLKLSGQGNFSRIQAPTLSKVEGWRNYPPESTFEADPASALKGVKRFDYIFIPEKAGTLELPELNFSFFDPDVEKYVELSSPAIAIEVGPSNTSAVPPPQAFPGSETATTAQKTDSLTKSLTGEELLRTLDYQPRTGRKLPSGSIFTPRFYWINCSLLAAVSIAALISYRRRCFSKKPNHALIQNAREELRITLNNTQKDDTSAFFGNALKAIRLAATIRAGSNLCTADFSTLEEFFRQIHMPETTIDQAREFFRSGEAHQFSPHHRTVDLSESRRQLKSILKAL